MYRAVLIGLTVLLMGACMAGNTENEVKAGEAFEVTVGASATLEGGGEFQFVAVREDSRCPEGVHCIWAGQAVVEVKFADGQAAKLTVPGGPDNAKAITEHSGVTLEFKSLAPYPKDGVELDPKSYVATFVFTR